MDDYWRDAAMRLWPDLFGAQGLGQAEIYSLSKPHSPGTREDFLVE